MKRAILAAAAVLVLDLGAPSAQSSTCPPGDATLLGVADIVVLAQPISAKLEEADGMYYVRGVYRVTETARGDAAGEVIVEFSCIDMANPATGEPDLGHCPAATGIGLPGFHRDGEGFRAGGPQLLFLARAATSPLDSTKVLGVVDRRPFHVCEDAPRKWESLQDRWKHVKSIESEAAPSPPLAAYDREVATKKAAASRSKSGGCN